MLFILISENIITVSIKGHSCNNVEYYDYYVNYNSVKVSPLSFQLILFAKIINVRYASLSYYKNNLFHFTLQAHVKYLRIESVK